MIKSYKDKRTERFAKGEFVKEFAQIQESADTRLARLDAADSLSALAQVPGNRLEALSGDRAGQHSIRINKKWRICFSWNSAERSAEEVEIVDYH
jgi:proteic killer suppression protein